MKLCWISGISSVDLVRDKFVIQGDRAIEGLVAAECLCKSVSSLTLKVARLACGLKYMGVVVAVHEESMTSLYASL